ncbi:triose-phosphate isomerase [Methylovirgula sp. 4M-Z18]|uniref:triose-phosphate isomerase n=1 Tax=Methylovirgula sp. 4M-Z18 TaxID=2293567 RepID=UPI000E2F2B4E|nr:triose-phosphate isomerase [Methylovirgula sp. 4M-Z18]RFB80553.1 triose-phosphate isomerase [Methylovirgula sp. 4M-Z18]
MNPRPLVAGNWKMNGLKAAFAELSAIRDAVSQFPKENVDFAICPPATLVSAAADMTRGTRLKIGGQDCHTKISGAHTGDISAAMLADAGAAYVILGHSERRADHHESDALVRAKAEAAIRAGLVAVVCVGETKDQRVAGDTLKVVEAQVDGSLPPGATADNLVIAYEPVWAIGTGLTPTAADVAEVHAFIRAQLKRLVPDAADGVRILYGGSVKPANAAELMAVANVNGALIGGASLKCDDFIRIAAAYK